ncbi:WapI family immunity protein [Leminorella grimontii]|uniref:WapI family immunity protein n=1 Tax=Leminorella grimontii TaxID=82981 RepID=UPI00208ADA13|nr:hypothetical protein [Leminorella grimontii]GKX58061.1 hypothetical protein SOASR031_03760 [Leminorella grimontii]
MLALTNIEGTVSLTLDVVGYQFPADEEDNWCLLKVGVIQGRDRFDKVDPSLETGDLTRLYNWFLALSERKLPSCARLDFIEPCLELEYVSHKGDDVTISVTLNCEIRPPFALKCAYGRYYGSPGGDKSWKLFFNLGEKDFSSILAALKMSMEKYPSRKHR